MLGKWVPLTSIGLGGRKRYISPGCHTPIEGMHHQTEFTLASPNLGVEKDLKIPKRSGGHPLSSCAQKWAEDRVPVRGLVEALISLSAQGHATQQHSPTPVSRWLGGSV